MANLVGAASFHFPNWTLFPSWKKQAIQGVFDNPSCFEDAPEEWAEDVDIVAAAIIQNPLMIRHASESMRRREDLATLAVSKNGAARVFLSQDLQRNEKIQRIARANIPNEFMFKKGSHPRAIFMIDDRVFTNLKKLGNFYPPIMCSERISPESSRFLRDAQVTLKRGLHLIPYPIQDPLFQNKILATLPSPLDQFLIHGEDLGPHFLGKGFHSPNIDQAVIYDIDYHIPFRRAKTCIEGGNCLFFTSKERDFALVGEISLYVSLFALEEQGFFKDKDLSYTKTPSDEAIRIARNKEIYESKKHPISVKRAMVEMSKRAGSDEHIKLKMELDQLTEKFGSEMHYRRELMEPVGTVNRLKYFEEAQKIERKLELTRALMAEELGISLKDLVILPQGNRFHIDMEVFVLDGIVYMHDDDEVIRLMSEIPKDAHTKYFDGVIVEAALGAPFTRRLNIEREHLLAAHGIKCVRFPGIFEGESTTLNYCNGIFLNRMVEKEVSQFNQTPKKGLVEVGRRAFLTTGPSCVEERVLHNLFRKHFEKLLPDIELCGIDNLSLTIARCNGGIRCLTLQSSLETAPDVETVS